MPKHKDQQSSKPAGWRECGYTRQLKLTRQQERHSKRAAGAARSVRNSAVEAGRMCARYGLKKRLDNGREVHYTALDMAREFNAIKKETDPYLKELGKFVVQGAFLDYEQSVRKWHAAIVRNQEAGSLQRTRTQRPPKRRTLFHTLRTPRVPFPEAHRRGRLPGRQR